MISHLWERLSLMCIMSFLLVRFFRLIVAGQLRIHIFADNDQSFMVVPTGSDTPDHLITLRIHP